MEVDKQDLIEPNWCLDMIILKLIIKMKGFEINIEEEFGSKKV
jgi:hypothetical protein